MYWPCSSRWLRNQQHDVFSVYEEARGITDDEVIEKAFTENRILITNDKDFGEKVFRDGLPHRGIIFMRLEDDRSSNKIKVLRQLLKQNASKLPDNFVVVTEKAIRFSSK